ncbi:indole-3-glycerol phosphate synthase [Fulvitalea axinellae]|uniref:indole-3-glycerol-phosphate synthase n=1 Tax=Fulvitalea axinellae TaxID=1182444 RepID=A0AAU9D1N3_9BACT|nr:indole-3-glycerol phosphate synthase [Fulvitalea axinellae]
MNILDKIIAKKREEVAEAKASRSVAELERMAGFGRKPLSSFDSLSKAGASGIIAEFKRRSPSKGDINVTASATEVTSGYSAAGASVLSVLTDESFFGGGLPYMREARAANPNTPILRKDFMIDEYQFIEAKAEGADLVLLIAAALKPEETKEFARFTQSLGMQVLLEVHNAQELDAHLNEYVNLVGVNNRDLTTFTTSVQTSYDLAERIPNEFLKVSESGINDASTIAGLKEVGYQGFLIGEYFMRQPNPAEACDKLIQDVNSITV